MIFTSRCLSLLIGGSIVLLTGCAHHPKQPASKPSTAVVQPTTLPTGVSIEPALKLIDERADWTMLPAIDIPRHPAERFLRGLTIVIDPGHGGTDGGVASTRSAKYKAGPGGEREAYINLRVGLLLERLLKDAGANVILTRHGDDTLSLVERAEVANHANNGAGADLFVSIHHNASGPGSNFTSVWYHGTVDNDEPDMDVARYLAHALGRNMRTQVAVTAPMLSSHLMYNTGFGVLRACKVPAVLCECSFFTNPPEEKRLRDPVYNLREAYGIYEGLCEWAYCGRPTQATPTVAREGDHVTISATLSEGLPAWWGQDASRILRSSVSMTLDEKPVAVRFDENSKRVTATLASSDVTRGEHVLTLHFSNHLANHNWPQRYGVTVSDDVQIKPLGALRLPRPTKPATTQTKP